MAHYLFDNPSKSYEFDFRKKFVKENGKRMTKFSIGYLISHNGDFYKGLLIEQEVAYSYDEAKQALLSHLEKMKFENVKIIK